MTDVLLICPKSDRPFHYKYVPLSPPLGLGYLGKALSLEGISFKILDMYCTPLSSNEIYQYISDENPKMIGFMVYTEAVNTMYTIAKMAKKINSNIFTFAGGPHATFKTVDIVKGHEELDVAIAHEGEEIIIELWNALQSECPDFSTIRGIAYKADEEVYFTGIRAPIHDLDYYGYPDRDWFPHVEKYLEPSTIISSRGCPGHCSFCGGANISGGLYRKRSVASVMEELDYLGKKFPNDVTIFWDDAFGFDTKRLRTLCEEMIRVKSHAWSCGIRVDRVSLDLLKLMKDAGCVKINFGVESGSQKVLDEAMKGVSLDQIRNAVKWAQEAGIYNSCSIIIGHPSDTVETVEETLRFAEELLNNGATSCTFNAMVPFPGTFVYEKREELGTKFIADAWEEYNFLNPVFETKGLNAEQLRKYLIEGLLLWGKYKNNRDAMQGRIKKRDSILLGEFLGRNVQT
ncbi:MAG: B12-binding domain-containing radical SAM protein [Acetatifactor sp.]